jgi:hypothetical protein
MLLDDARWNESPDPSDVENKLQDIATDPAVFQIDRDLESDWLRNTRFAGSSTERIRSAFSYLPICVDKNGKRTGESNGRVGRMRTS